MRIHVSLLFLALALTLGYHSTQNSADAPASTIGSSETTTTTISDTNRSDRDPNPLLGQHFMIGHWADSPVASTTELIRTYGIGGVIIMSAPEDPSEIRTWVTEWQRESPVPLLIGIDQEGGPVSRLTGDSFTTTGQAHITDVDVAYEIGYARGQELHELGINLNFAPVLDTARNPESFMFSRVFPDRARSPALVAAMVRGMKDAGVIAVVKHFPGHDDTSDDSHVTLPIVAKSGSELEEFLVPFHTLLTTEPPRALMTAHVAFPSVDPLPATLSPYWLETYLRDTAQFSGVIVTDDMIMDAIDTTWPHNTASTLALQAGADLILYAAEPEKVGEAIMTARNALTEGSLSRERLQDSTDRLNLLRREIQ